MFEVDDVASRDRDAFLDMECNSVITEEEQEVGAGGW